MKTVTGKKVWVVATVSVLSVLGLFLLTPDKTTATVVTKPKAALNVRVCKPETADWPNLLSANGSILAWQEAVIGAELSGLQLANVLVDVGDQVKRGQVLARFVSDSVNASVEEQKASLEVANAALSEAQANADRARILETRNALSEQQIKQYLTAERSASARVMAESARLQSEKIRQRQTEILAPDDGVISSRSATIGVVAQQGQELFRLVRKNRLEWRAEVTPENLMRIQIKQTVNLALADGRTLQGEVRMIAPTVDSKTRTALVYVDLPADVAVRAGMFATGQFELGASKGLTVPQSAVVFRDGSSFVFHVAADGKVAQTQVALGRRIGERIEVTQGITEQSTLVTQGAGFLADGDTVHVVDTALTSTTNAKVNSSINLITKVETSL